MISESLSVKTLEGKYLASEVITGFNVKSLETINTNIEYIIIIKKVYEDQYITESIYFNESIPFYIQLFVKDSQGWISHSYSESVNKLFYENGSLVQTFTNAQSGDVLKNGVIKMYKLDC